jgi:GTP-binding protein
VTFAGSAAGPGQFPTDGLPEVAFLGRSNVGKSSLLNALCGQKALARVSSQPGRTQLVNFFRVEDRCYFVDLPGYGYAKAPGNVRERWKELVTSYLVGREALALCLFLVDVRHDPQPGDETLKTYLDHYGLPRLLAATKADKLARGEVNRRTQALARSVGAGAQGVVAVSAQTGAGVDELWRAIQAGLAGGDASPAAH